MKQKRIAVVGAGLTGLTAALQLQQQGHAVQLYERDNNPGGRTRSIRQDGFVFDVGAITLLPTYRETCSLIEQLGLGDRLQRIEPIIGIPRGGRMHRLQVARPIRSLLTTGLVSSTAKLRLLKLFKPLRRAWARSDFHSLAPLAEWDSESIASYLRRELNEEILEYIAGPIIRGNTLNSPEDAPFGELLWMLRQYAAPYLYGLDQGINLLAETLAERLTVAYGSTVNRVERYAGQVRVNGHSSQGPFSHDYDACVLALPPQPLLALAPNLTPDQRHFLETIKPLPSVSLHLGLRRMPAISETFILPPRSEQAELTTIVMDHLKAPGRAPVGKGVISLFCRDDWAAAHLHSPDQQIFDSILGMARPFVGDLRGDIESYRIQRWPYAIIKSEVGLYTRMRAYERDLDASDPIQLAGDFLSMGMEAAVLAGKAAAERLAQQ